MPGGGPGWRSRARTSWKWVQAGGHVLGWLSAFSGRAMLTSGGHITSSHPSAGLLNGLRAGMVGSSPHPDMFSVFSRCNRRASRSRRAASSTSAKMGPSPSTISAWLTRADTSAQQETPLASPPAPCSSPSLVGYLLCSLGLLLLLCKEGLHCVDAYALNICPYEHEHLISPASLQTNPLQA